jgi:hypothetical protein
MSPTSYLFNRVITVTNNECHLSPVHVAKSDLGDISTVPVLGGYVKSGALPNMGSIPGSFLMGTAWHGYDWCNMSDVWWSKLLDGKKWGALYGGCVTVPDLPLPPSTRGKEEVLKPFPVFLATPDKFLHAPHWCLMANCLTLVLVQGGTKVMSSL